MPSATRSESPRWLKPGERQQNHNQNPKNFYWLKWKETKSQDRFFPYIL